MGLLEATVPQYGRYSSVLRHNYSAYKESQQPTFETNLTSLAYTNQASQLPTLLILLLPKICTKFVFLPSAKPSTDM